MMHGSFSAVPQVCPCSRVLVFQCSDDTMTERLKQRGLSSGRDDNKETIRKRLETFHQQTIPVISHYHQKDKMWEVSIKEKNMNKKLIIFLGEC